MILELPTAKVNKCANLGKRVWEFRWDQSLSTELMGSLLHPEGYLKGVLNARIHLNPEAAESVWAALIPIEQTGANDSCAAARMGLELAPALALEGVPSLTSLSSCGSRPFTKRSSSTRCGP